MEEPGATRCPHRHLESMQLGPRTKPVQYASTIRGHEAYSDLAGVESNQLSRHVKSIKNQMDKCADPCTVHTTGRRTELAAAVAALPEIRAAAEKLGQPTIAHKAIACGIDKRLAELRAGNYQHTLMGRTAYNNIVDAAICCIDEHINASDKSGDLTAVARILGISDRSLYDLRKRSAELDLRTLLDPTRETRSDATDEKTIQQITN